LCVYFKLIQTIFFPFSGGQHIAGEMMCKGDVFNFLFVLVCMFCFVEFEHGHAVLYSFSFVLNFFLFFVVCSWFTLLCVLYSCFIFIFFVSLMFVVLLSWFHLLGVEIEMNEADREN